MMPGLALVADLPPARAPVYGFADADLGEPFGTWRLTAAGARAACALSPRPDEGRICRAVDIPIGGGFLARDLTFRFTRGRLTGVSFRSSIDGYAFAMALLKTRFGPPRSILRDGITDADGLSRAHVEAIWRNGRSEITLDDPVRDTAQLGVSVHRGSASADPSRRD